MNNTAFRANTVDIVAFFPNRIPTRWTNRAESMFGSEPMEPGRNIHHLNSYPQPRAHTRSQFLQRTDHLRFIILVPT